MSLSNCGGHRFAGKRGVKDFPITEATEAINWTMVAVLRLPGVKAE
jgi:hypothetical protein